MTVDKQQWVFTYLIKYEAKHYFKILQNLTNLCISILKKYKKHVLDVNEIQHLKRCKLNTTVTDFTTIKCEKSQVPSFSSSKGTLYQPVSTKRLLYKLQNITHGQRGSGQTNLPLGRVPKKFPFCRRLLSVICPFCQELFLEDKLI